MESDGTADIFILREYARLQNYLMGVRHRQVKTVRLYLFSSMRTNISFFLCFIVLICLLYKSLPA